MWFLEDFCQSSLRDIRNSRFSFGNLVIALSKGNGTWCMKNSPSGELPVDGAAMGVKL